MRERSRFAVAAGLLMFLSAIASDASGVRPAAPMSITQGEAAAEVAARIPDPGLFPEGVAADPATGDLFVSSLRRRLVLRVGTDGRVRTFLSPTAGIWAVFGLRFDPDRGLLWAATAAMPFMEGFEEPLRGRAALLAIDRRGRVRHRYEPGRSGTERLLGDVLVARDGTVWSTDSIGGGVFTVPPDRGSMRATVPDGTFASPQGLAIPATREHLYLADYRTGIWRLPLAGGSPEQLESPQGAEVRGIDGLYAWGDDLVAVQNGTRTRRVLMLRLGHDGGRIVRVDTILAEHPSFRGGEPTLGTIHGGHLLLVANSLWPRLGQGSAFPEDALLPEPVILRVELPMASVALE